MGGLAVAVLSLGELGLGVGILMVAVATLVCTRRDRGSVLVGKAPHERASVLPFIGLLALRWPVPALVLLVVLSFAGNLLLPLIGPRERQEWF